MVYAKQLLPLSLRTNVRLQVALYSINLKKSSNFEKNIGIGPSSYTNTMMVELGETLYFAAGSDKNIKLTTKDNLEMFKAFLKMNKDDWLK